MRYGKGRATHWIIKIRQNKKNRANMGISEPYRGEQDTDMAYTQ